MIPCLYSATETTFTTNGIGKLADCISCVVTEKRNDSYELLMKYPSDGIHADELTEGAIIYAKPADNKSPQAFRIYKITTPMDGKLEVAARHISYQLNFITCSPVTVDSDTADHPAEAFEALKAAASSDCPFSFVTDLASETKFSISEPTSFRNALGGIEGSMMDTFGGEFEWDMFTVNLWKARGADNGVRIVYGKNLVDFKMEKSIEDTITGVHPYWRDSEGETLVELPEKVVTLAESDFPFEKITTLDCTEAFEEEPTEAELRAYAEAYLASTDYTEPDIDIDIDFAQLWQMPGYEDIAEAERVSLCDTVHVYVSKLGIEVSAKVTETKYDVLLERYQSITLSNSITSSRNTSLALSLSQEIANQLDPVYNRIVKATAIANGKTTTYYSSEAPEGTAHTINDIWFDTSDGYAMYYWTGVKWTKAPYGTGSLDEGSITTSLLAAECVTAGKISVDKLSAITGNVGTLTSGILKSSNYDADKGTGLLIDLDNGTIAGSDLTLLATQISNISVGGRNYLTGTRDFDSGTWDYSSNVTLAADDEGYTVATFAATDAAAWNGVFSRLSPLLFSAVRGQTVTLSFEVRSDDHEALNALTNRGLVAVFALCTGSSISRTLYHRVNCYATEVLSDSWQRVSVPAALTDDCFSGGSGTIDDDTRFYIQIYDYSVYSMQVRKVKLELGTVATDWTPAPEDTDDQIAAKLALTVDDNRVATISGNADRIELTSGQLVITSDNFSLTEDGTIAANAGTVGPLIITNSADTDNETGHYTDVSAMMQSYGTTVTALDTTADTTRTVTVDMEWGLKSCGTRSTNAVMYLCVKKPKDDWSSSTAPRLFSLTGRGHLKCSGLEVFPTCALDVSDYGTDEESIALADDEVRCAYTDNAYLHFNSVKFDAQSVYSDIDPVYSNTYDLGGSDYYWRRVYCDTIYRNSTASTSSDRKLKKNIKPLTEAFESFIMGLTPVSFAYKNGHRTHMGFEAQGVKDVALSTVGDLALFRASVIGDDKAPYSADIPDEKLRWYLSYEELIAPLVAMVQHQQRRIERLEAALNIQKEEKTC